MVIELDALVGHPKHELLFSTPQVVRTAGLKAPSVSVSKMRSKMRIGRALLEIMPTDNDQRLILPGLNEKNKAHRKDA